MSCTNMNEIYDKFWQLFFFCYTWNITKYEVSTYIVNIHEKTFLLRLKFDSSISFKPMKLWRCQRQITKLTFYGTNAEY